MVNKNGCKDIIHNDANPFDEQGWLHSNLWSLTFSLSPYVFYYPLQWLIFNYEAKFYTCCLGHTTYFLQSQGMLDQNQPLTSWFKDFQRLPGHLDMLCHLPSPFPHSSPKLFVDDSFLQSSHFIFLTFHQTAHWC